VTEAPLTFGQAVDPLGAHGYGRDASLDTNLPATADREEIIQLLAFRHPETAEVAYVYGDDFDAPRVKLPGQEPEQLNVQAGGKE